MSVLSRGPLDHALGVEELFSRTKLFGLLPLLALLLWPAFSAQAQSATGGAPIIVNTTKDETTPNDNECSLREAIQNAKDNAQTSSDCKAGRGGDTITFKKGLSGTITLDPDLGPLTVTGSAGLTIDGGRESITVSGDDQVQCSPRARVRR